MMLAIDAGNTRIKWAVYDHGWKARGAMPTGAHAGLAQVLAEHPGLRRCVVSSVAGAAVDDAFRACFAERGIGLQWIAASPEACGVRNGYAQPEQLGSDRWASLIAAWNLNHAASVVATAGTALTVDALSPAGEFVGGLIVPGLGLMRQSLLGQTAGVAVAAGELRSFPINTGDAVTSGALRAMAGAVQGMMDALRHSAQAEPRLLLSGGDASALQAALSGAGEIVDNLVLEGLVLLAGEKTE